MSSKGCGGPRRVYRPYWEWEDHRAGLYGTPSDVDAETRAARELLADPGRLEPAMRAVVTTWAQSAEHQLSNLEQNRRAWVGQAACRYAVNATSFATRTAWGQLTDAQRVVANACADRVIHDWELIHPGELTLWTMGR